eukprot:2739519-Prymnesium_polylepis.1
MEHLTLIWASRTSPSNVAAGAPPGAAAAAGRRREGSPRDHLTAAGGSDGLMTRWPDDAMA